MPKVPKLLIEYHGREGELFSKLERKYKLPVLKSVISTKAARLDNPEAFAGHQNIYDKLLDHRLFTGHHKHRFDDDGRGRGLDGRDYVMKGHGTFGITRYFPGADNSVDEPRRTPWPRRGYSVETGVRRRYNDHGYNGDTNQKTDTRFTCISQFMVRQDSPRPFRPAHGKPTNVLPRNPSGGGTTSPRPPPAARPGKVRPQSAGPRRANGYPLSFADVNPPIFQKLTDPKLYTGHHKHRFDERGNGKGSSGRDCLAKGGEFAPMNPDHHQYVGNTNTGTDVTFHCISQFLNRENFHPNPRAPDGPKRPDSARGKRPRPQSAGASSSGRPSRPWVAHRVAQPA